MQSVKTRFASSREGGFGVVDPDRDEGRTAMRDSLL